MKVQEDFKDLGSVTLDELDAYIAACDAVVHLVGEMTGAAAKAESTRAIVSKYHDIIDKLPPLREPLVNRVDISYTQWEAWLALYHDKLLQIAKAHDEAPRGPRFASTEESRAAQRAHLERLRAVERYPGCTFTSPDNLAKQIFSGAILDLLARESLSAASIEQIETAVRAQSPKLTAAQIDRFIQSLRELKGDPSFARAVEEARNGNTRVAEGIWLQIYENRKKEQQKAQQEQAEAARYLAASAITNSVAEGLKWYREATSLDTDNMAGWVELGDAAMAAGTLREADAAFLRYIELARRSRDAREAANLAPDPIALFCCIYLLQNDPMIYGYARVSTDGQSVDAQVTQLRAAGAEKVFREVASGAKTERAQLRHALDQLDAGDVLLVTRLDRLAQSTRDLVNTLGAIAEKGAGFRSLGDTWADTTTAPGRLMVTVLGGLAQFERELIRARTGEGRERAKARGVKMGRRPKLTPHQKREPIKRRDVGEEAFREIAASYNVSAATISEFMGFIQKQFFGRKVTNNFSLLLAHPAKPKQRSKVTMRRTSKHSNFQEMSQCFAKIIDAADEDRDDVVREEIDRLHGQAASICHNVLSTGIVSSQRRKGRQPAPD